jgi:hypothetical protein
MNEDKTIPELNSVSERGGANNATVMAAAHSYNGQLEDVKVSVGEIAGYVEQKVKVVNRVKNMLELYAIPRSNRFIKMRVVVEFNQIEFVLINNPETEGTTSVDWQQSNAASTNVGTWQQAEEYMNQNLQTIR